MKAILIVVGIIVLIALIIKIKSGKGGCCCSGSDKKSCGS
jgi:hypothetical protein